MVASSPVWAYGAEKYAAWNWMKGMDWSVPIGCIMRPHRRHHGGTAKIMTPESGLSSLGSCHLQCADAVSLYADVPGG